MRGQHAGSGEAQAVEAGTAGDDGNLAVKKKGLGHGRILFRAAPLRAPGFEEGSDGGRKEAIVQPIQRLIVADIASVEIP